MRHSCKVSIAAPHAGLRKAKLERPALQPQWHGGLQPNPPECAAGGRKAGIGSEHQDASLPALRILQSPQN